MPTIFWVLFLGFFLRTAQCEVTYDRKAIVINGQRRILISGSIHYPRSTPDVFPLTLVTFFLQIGFSFLRKFL